MLDLSALPGPPPREHKEWVCGSGWALDGRQGLSDPAATSGKGGALGTLGRYPPLDGESAALASEGIHRRCKVHPDTRAKPATRRRIMQRLLLDDRPFVDDNTTVIESLSSRSRLPIFLVALRKWRSPKSMASASSWGIE